jgi:hypothetical protein
MAGGWRTMLIEELHNLNDSPNVIRVIKLSRFCLAGQVNAWKTLKNAYKIMVGKPEGKKPLGTPGHRWKGNVRMYFKETG